jgi:hypothetical protein
VLYDANAVSLLEVFEASRDVCRILWIVGWSGNESSNRTLSRFGDVVDVTGMSESEAVSHVVRSEPDGVLVFHDAPIKFASAIAEELGLRFHGRHTAQLLSDKMAQRAALEAAGLPVPVFAAVRRNNIDVNVPFPAVLKPRSGAGSRDTFKVDNFDQVHEALIECSPTEEFILEELLPDRTSPQRLASDIVSVESIVREGQIEHVVITARFPFAPPFRETGSFLPSHLATAERDEVRALASAALNALSVRHGLVHTEIKLTPTGPRVVEVNGRIGGGIRSLVSRLGGPSLTLWVVQLALGLDIGPIPTFGPSPIAFFRFIVAPESATRLKMLNGVEGLRDLAGVDEFVQKLQPGDAVNFRRSSWAEHALQIDGMVNSYAELVALIDEEIPATLHLEWEE